ncbi:PREDICTED: 8-oxo-dGDP phosphatase NUDT18-like [Priapulus caudatus]|uniref:8-oxo-dGDP phosphatase NUDT18-like n=1 Tax=Priapulus caudatus TaxID=37621 RepID=A0ABM1EJP0_PRICU|nr:PREDICTED: 8-oxo-dGDP phosphatase NUDT18-like [Priapulus caudatus]
MYCNKLSSIFNISGGHFSPVVQKTVCYIACGLIINEVGQVLMIQEARRLSRGKWYLPAGRMEPGENIEDAVRREVLEEAGYECQVTSVLMVEVDGRALWLRFTCLARVTGGNRKTEEDENNESMQARWFTLDEIAKLELRNTDISHCELRHTVA